MKQSSSLLATSILCVFLVALAGPGESLTAQSVAQQAYLKASHTEGGDSLGYSVAVDGDTLVIRAYKEDSVATGPDGDEIDNGANGAGAISVFVAPRSSL